MGVEGSVLNFSYVNIALFGECYVGGEEEEEVEERGRGVNGWGI